MKKLSLVKGEEGLEVAVGIKATDSHYHINFSIEHREENKWNISPQFQGIKDRFWELWNYDVFEIFLKLNPLGTWGKSGAQYLEFELSPLEQTLVLGFFSPRQKSFTPINFPWSYKCRFEQLSWKGEIQLPKDEVLIEGNIHACLGTPQSFYSLYPGRGKELDFHQPQQFSSLL